MMARTTVFNADGKTLRIIVAEGSVSCFTRVMLRRNMVVNSLE